MEMNATHSVQFLQPVIQCTAKEKQFGKNQLVSVTVRSGLSRKRRNSMAAAFHSGNFPNIFQLNPLVTAPTVINFV
jgi:hypothetical protein